ncbi:hypothetical protein CJF42_09560 [Pseudoalteromonas sp. NBT06-2]|uniref:hypothetical protein n=1 Tax=Pseudoalteromonas sp. NBT06-2 TaxID=2025950 RepID=UPI000BA6C694|nr:hypothetical protein [Pseudoalteromonas sp. NBT06-2]PAJ74559.1 hypothetical protein CJF42_09560 [Pseudoalteromonas sp. NBT06-2]
MSNKEATRHYSFTFNTLDEANQVCNKIQHIFKPDNGTIFVDGLSLYILKENSLSHQIHKHVSELKRNPDFKIEKRIALKKTLFTSAILASTAIIPSFPVFANTELFIGEWQTTYGTLRISRFSEDTDLLVGIYGDNDNNRIIGSVQNNVFSGMWYRSETDTLDGLNEFDDETSGLFIFVIGSERQFDGGWVRHGREDEASTLSEGDYWNGVRTGVPHTNVTDTVTPVSILFNSTYGDIDLQRQGNFPGYVGTYDNGDVILIKLGLTLGGLWLHNTGRFGSLALANTTEGTNLIGRWDYIQGAMRGGEWRFEPRDEILETSYSPYASVAANAQWLKGEGHTHAINYTGTNRDTGSTGGKLDHSQLMSVLNEQGHAFVGLTGHECYPGEHRIPGYRNSPEIDSNDIPDGFTPFKVLENQVRATEPNWPENNPHSARWAPITNGDVHRIYLDTDRDVGFIMGHPDYYPGIVVNGQVDQATSRGQRMLGVEVYNRYGDDRCPADIESLGSKGANPYGFEFWDNQLSSDSRDYPIWAFAGDDSFLHKHGRQTSETSLSTALDAAPAVKYRNDKGFLITALPDDFNEQDLENRQNEVTNSLTSGKFYASGGKNIRFSNIYYDTNNHTLSVTAERPVNWYVYCNNQQLRLGINNESGHTSIDYSAGSFTQSTTSADIITQPRGYTRLEARISEQVTISNRLSVTTSYRGISCLPVVVSGDVSDLATEGEFLYFVNERHQPAVIVQSEFSEANNETTIYILNDGGGQTDSRMNPNRYLNYLTVGDTMKFVQRAWLQPAWANPSDDFNSVVEQLEAATVGSR